jgi:hypothetical protein
LYQNLRSHKYEFIFIKSVFTKILVCSPQGALRRCLVKPLALRAPYLVAIRTLGDYFLRSTKLANQKLYLALEFLQCRFPAI